MAYVESGYGVRWVVSAGILLHVQLITCNPAARAMFGKTIWLQVRPAITDLPVRPAIADSTRHHQYARHP